MPTDDSQYEEALFALRTLRLVEQAEMEGTASLSVHGQEENWDFWLRLFNQRTDDDEPNVIVVTGPTGCGKSTFAIRMAQRLMAMRPGLPPFNFQHMTYGALDLLRSWDRIKDEGKGTVIVADEGIKGGMGRQSQTAENVELLSAINFVRILGATVLYLIPDIHDLDAGWRDRAVKFWAAARERPKGSVVMHMRPDNPVSYWRRPPNSLGLYQHATLEDGTDIGEYSPLRWDPVGGKEWEDYEVNKKKRVHELLKESIAKLEGGPAKEEKANRESEDARRLLSAGVSQRLIAQTFHHDVGWVRRQKYTLTEEE